jgi:lipopolysaccharide/colanic/teichoic acid biosynthesis glycosyltransferase
LLLGAVAAQVAQVGAQSIERDHPVAAQFGILKRDVDGLGRLPGRSFASLDILKLIPVIAPHSGIFTIFRFAQTNSRHSGFDMITFRMLMRPMDDQRALAAALRNANFADRRLFRVGRFV